MEGPFDSHSLNFGGLLGQFEPRLVIVPQFQRGYSWEKTHVATFWADLLDFHTKHTSASPSERYFLGPIVILPEGNQITLLDGQQRLATATILFAIIRDAARALGTAKGNDLARDIHRDLIENEENRFSLQLSELDKAYFLSTIQRDPVRVETPRLRSHMLIKSAREFLAASIAKFIEGCSPDEAVLKLKLLRDTLATSVTMVAISVNSEEDAFRIFETLNDRGLRLSVPDLLLNYLMRTAINDGSRASIRERWNFMLEKMGRKDIDRFLRHMWLSKYGDVKARGLFSEIKDFLQQKKADSVQFAEACATECEDYVAILDLDEAILEASRRDVAALVKYLDVSSSLPLLLAGFRCLSKSDFGKLASMTTALVIRHAVIGNLNPSDLETAFYSAARTIRTLKENGERSAKCLKEARTLLANINPPDRDILPRAETLYLTRGEAVFILTNVANRMQSRTHELGVDDANLEHIFPQNPDPSWGDTSQLEPLTWHLGNLTILGTKLNRQAANSDYATKASHHYAGSEITMTSELLRKYTVWTPAEILDRARNLAPSILHVWKGP